MEASLPESEGNGENKLFFIWLQTIDMWFVYYRNVLEKFHHRGVMLHLNPKGYQGAPRFFVILCFSPRLDFDIFDIGIGFNCIFFLRSTIILCCISYYLEGYLMMKIVKISSCFPSLIDCIRKTIQNENSTLWFWYVWWSVKTISQYNIFCLTSNFSWYFCDCLISIYCYSYVRGFFFFTHTQLVPNLLNA